MASPTESWRGPAKPVNNDWSKRKHVGKAPEIVPDQPPDNIVSRTCLNCEKAIIYSKVMGEWLHWRKTSRYCRGTRGKVATPIAPGTTLF